MGEGKLAAVVTVACGFLVGYKWPKIRKQFYPLYRREVKRFSKFAKQGIQDAAGLFAGRTAGTRKVRRRVLAKA